MECLPREIHDSDSEAYFTGVYPACPACPVKSKNYLTGVGRNYRTGVESKNYSTGVALANRAREKNTILTEKLFNEFNSEFYIHTMKRDMKKTKKPIDFDERVLG